MIRAITILLAIGSLAVTAADPIVKSTYKGSAGLNDLAKTSGKYMGTAVDQDLNDPTCVKELQNIHDFSMITPANAMKWDATEPRPNVFTFAAADKIVATAKASGAKVRCHTLLWHDQAPAWVHNLGKADLLKALTNHITKVMTHFGDSCYAWDVANEVMDDDARYRQSFWYTKTGTDFLSTAFRTASAVKKSLGLKTKLYYNDYNTNTINAKSTAVLNMVKSLMSQGIAIDGVGFQSHFDFSSTASTADQVANLKRFTDLGLDVALTELDVTTPSSWPTTTQQKQQMTVYKNAVAACKALPKCVGVSLWGFSDNYSWLKTRSPLPWYQPGGSNTALVRKSLYDGIVAGWGARNFRA